MSAIRWRAVLLGAAAFLTAHVMERALWAEWFSGGADVPAWFTNSGRAVLATAVMMFVAGIVSAQIAGDRVGSISSMRGAMSACAGGVAALVLSLLAIGAGTLAPLAIVIGSALVIASTFAGALAAAKLAKP